MILLALVLASAGVCAGDDNQRSSNKTIKLVEKIRRQLMEDNYDYLPSADELLTPVHALDDKDKPNDALEDNDNDDNERNGDKYEHDEDKNALNDMSNNKDRSNDIKPINKYSFDKTDNDADRTNERIGSNNENNESDQNPDDNEHFVPRAQADASDEESNKKKEENTPKEHVVSKKDLLYYVDDERLRRRRLNNGLDSAAPQDFEDAADAVDSSTAKYKVIKVKSLHPNRRSQGVRRFIQEESANGVAIINLDDQPFPEFHLPRSRRQYMRGGDSAELSDEPRHPRRQPPVPR